MVEETQQEEMKASVQLVKIYDREEIKLFDNNFNIMNGPDTSDLEIKRIR